MPRILNQEVGENPYDQAANLMGQASDVYGNAANNTPTALGSMNQYLNPYYQNVMRDVTRNMQRDMRVGLNQIGDEAQAAGAFGGGRHGLREATYMGEVNRNIGDISNQMQMQQFNTAANLGAADANRNLQGMLAGAGGLAGMGQNYYNIGNDITNRQMQAGQQQQSLLQQSLSQASGQFDSYIQSPTDALRILMAGLASDPRQANFQGYGANNASGEAGRQPGAADYLQAGLRILSMF